MTCPFCEPKQRVLKENERAYVLLSSPRKVEGHTLVIPKRHVENPLDIISEEVVDVFELIKFVQSRVIGTLGEGCTIKQNYFPFIPDDKFKVRHMHYHVLPRKFADQLFHFGDNQEKKLFEELSQEEHDRVAKLLE